MVTSSLMPTHEVDSERNVILEEIAMHDDDPDDVVHDAFVAALYGDDPARPGDHRQRRVDQRADAAPDPGYYRRRYTADNLVFAAAGNVDHADVVRLVRAGLRAADALGDPDRGPASVRAAGRRPPAQRHQRWSSVRPSWRAS